MISAMDYLGEMYWGQDKRLSLRLEQEILESTGWHDNLVTEPDIGEAINTFLLKMLPGDDNRRSEIFGNQKKKIERLIEKEELAYTAVIDASARILMDVRYSRKPFSNDEYKLFFSQYDLKYGIDFDANGLTGFRLLDYAARQMANSPDKIARLDEMIVDLNENMTDPKVKQLWVELHANRLKLLLKLTDALVGFANKNKQSPDPWGYEPVHIHFNYVTRFREEVPSLRQLYDAAGKVQKTYSP